MNSPLRTMITWSVFLLACLQAWSPFQPSRAEAFEPLTPWMDMDQVPALTDSAEMLQATPGGSDEDLFYFQNDFGKVGFKDPGFIPNLLPGNVEDSKEKRRLRFHKRSGLYWDSDGASIQEDKRRLRFHRRSEDGIGGVQSQPEKRRLRLDDNDQDRTFEKRRLRFHGGDGLGSRGFSQSELAPRLRFHHLRKRAASTQQSDKKLESNSGLARNKRTVLTDLSGSELLQEREKKHLPYTSWSFTGNLAALADIVADVERQKQTEREEMIARIKALGKRSSLPASGAEDANSSDLASRIEQLLLRVK